ncbi:uncharacterized protein LOC117109515 [Anneissia japonica]|uniref:uncharacterized protein LOC117109515 n=1 Tax=Anneissia japonica TaxID=1529436 RepID=UPI00142564E7|nr:uncharacterized protein LOC117109515 [Anneissia japonica]XP_033107778.1 uncharacterized protein LOC117109515 [Anneissia japonica]
MKNVFNSIQHKLKSTESPDSVDFEESVNYEIICRLVCELGNQMIGQYHSKNSNSVVYDDVSSLIDGSYAKEHFNHPNFTSDENSRCKEPNSNELELKTFIPVTQSTIPRDSVYDGADLDQVSYIDICDKIYQYYKSKLKKHETHRLTSTEFDADWEYVTRLFSALGVSNEEIQKYKNRPTEKQKERVKEDYINLGEAEETVPSLQTAAPVYVMKTHVLSHSSRLQEPKELGLIIVLSTVFLGLSITFFILVTKHKSPKMIKELLVILALLIVTGFPMFRCIIKRQIKAKQSVKKLNARQLYMYA